MNKKPAMAFMAGVVLSLGLGGVTGCQNAPGPEQTVSKALRAWNAQNINGFLATMDPDTEAAVHMLMTFQNMEKNAKNADQNGNQEKKMEKEDETTFEESLRAMMFIVHLDQGAVQQKTIAKDQARITTAVTARALIFEGQLNMQFDLRMFPKKGWRIVDIQPTP